MNFYRHYLGDYGRKTAHLSLMEHGAYRLLLDHCYALGKPLPADLESLCRICRAQTDLERKAVKSVADQFFPLNGDGTRHNKRADEELVAYAKQADTNRQIAAEREAKRKEHESLNGSLDESFNEAGTNDQPKPEVRSQKLEVTKPEAISHKPEKSKAFAAGPSAAATWEAYSTAYVNRYQTEPVRNAKVNGQLADFCKRISHEEAPHVAAFYVGHNNPFYVRSRHPVGALLKDAEGLRTQWATGVKATGLEARSAEQVDAAQAQLKRLTGEP